MKYIIYIITFSILALNLQAQLVTVKGDFSSDTIMLGEQLQFTLTIDAASGVKTGMPILTDTLSGDIEVVDVVARDTSRQEGREVITHTYRVTSFRKGSNMVAPLPVPFTSGDLADTIYTYPAFLFVEAPEIDTTQSIKPIKGPVNTPVNFAEMLPWLLLGLGVAAVIAGVVWMVKYYRKRKVSDGGSPPAPKEPAHVVALRDLDALAAADLPGKGMVKEYYSKLTQIIRVYMEEAFRIPAMERITFEIIEEFTPHASGNEKLIGQLRELLELADLVKFAKEDPQKEENERHLANGYDFVKRSHALQQELEKALSETGTSNDLKMEGQNDE